MVAPVPVGVGASFSNVAANVATANFTLNRGFTIVTFQPYDVNNPGVATLYDSNNVVILTLNQEGYEPWIVPHNDHTYYFKATLGAKLVAMTMPTGV